MAVHVNLICTAAENSITDGCIIFESALQFTGTVIPGSRSQVTFRRRTAALGSAAAHSAISIIRLDYKEKELRCELERPPARQPKVRPVQRIEEAGAVEQVDGPIVEQAVHPGGANDSGPAVFEQSRASKKRILEVVPQFFADPTPAHQVGEVWG
jgi:hypothetical protein